MSLMLQRRLARQWIGSPTILSYWMTDDPLVSREEALNEIESMGDNWWNPFGGLSGLNVFARWRGEGLTRGVDVRDYDMIGIDRLTEVLEGGRRMEAALELSNEIKQRRAMLLAQVEETEEDFRRRYFEEEERNYIEYRVARDYMYGMLYNIEHNIWVEDYLVRDEQGRWRRGTWSDVFPPL